MKLRRWEIIVMLAIVIPMFATLAYAAFFAYESITVSSTVKTLTSATYARAVNALITVEGNYIRFTIDGVNTPTSAGVGHRLEVGQSLTLGPPWGTVDDVRNFKAVRGSATDATLKVSYKVP